MLTEWLGETSIVGMVLSGSLIAKLVLLILALMSALSWAIIIIKAFQYYNIRKEDKKFYQIYLNESSLNQIKKVSSEYLFSAFSFMFSATYQEAARMSQRIQRSSPSIAENNSMLPHLSLQLQRVIEKNYQWTTHFHRKPFKCSCNHLQCCTFHWIVRNSLRNYQLLSEHWNNRSNKSCFSCSRHF